MNNFDSENYADSDSDNTTDMTLNCSIDESSYTVADDDDLQRIFERKDPEEQDSIRILDFTGKHRLKQIWTNKACITILSFYFPTKSWN